MVDKWRLASILGWVKTADAVAGNIAPMLPEVESAFAELLALRRDIALSNEALAACQAQAAGRIRVLEAALAQALENIKIWHNMGGADAVWPIYFRSAPEMRLIREALPPCFSLNGRGSDT